VDEERADIPRLRKAVQDTWFLGVMGIACAVSEQTVLRYKVGDEFWSIIKERFQYSMKEKAPNQAPTSTAVTPAPAGKPPAGRLRKASPGEPAGDRASGTRGSS
jgi:hypothetical protein